MPKYTFSNTTDFSNGADASALHQEIQNSAIVTALDYVTKVGDVVDVWFKAALSAGDETVLNSIIAAHTGQALVELPLVFSPTWEDTKGLDPQWKGYLYTATAGALSFFDEVITSELKLRGGWYETLTGASAAEGDYVEFSVVDKDDTLGLFATYGLTVGVDVLELKKYVKSEYVNPGVTGVRQSFIVGGAFAVTAGLYLRTAYNSVGATDVKFKTLVFSYE